MPESAPKKKDAETRKQDAALSVALAQAALRRAEARVGYDQAVKEHVYFTRTWNTAIEAVMNDKLASHFQRVMAWAYRWSWGEYSLFAIGLDGFPKLQVDCARELGLSKQQVSGTVTYAQKRGHLEDVPKQIQPAIAPVLGPQPEGPADSAAYKAFVESWKVANSSDFARMEEAHDVYLSIKRVLLTDYKKSRREQTKEATTLLETQESNTETIGKPAAVSPFERDNQRIAKEAGGPPAKNPAKTGMQAKDQSKEAVDFLFSEFARMQKAYPNSDFAHTPINLEDKGDQGLVKRVLHELGSCDNEYLVGFVVHCAARFKGFAMGGRQAKERKPGTPAGPYSLGLLVNWAQDYARIAKPTSAEIRRAEVSPKAQRALAIIERVEAEWDAMSEADRRKLIAPHVKEMKADPVIRKTLDDREIYNQAALMARAAIRERIENEGD